MELVDFALRRDAPGGGDAAGRVLSHGQNCFKIGAAHQAFGVDMRVEELTAERLQGANRIDRPYREDRFPAVNRDMTAATVHRGDDLLGADRIRELFRKVEVGLAVPEERGSGDDLPGSGREDVACALDRADAAPDSAREGRGDLPDDVEV